MGLTLVSERAPRPGDAVSRKDGRQQKIAANGRSPHVHIRSRGHYVADLVLELGEFRDMFTWAGDAWVEA